MQSSNGTMTNLNLQLFEELRDLMGSNFELLVDTYISDNKARKEQLQLAIESSDWENVRQLSHAMKSSSANIGALQLSELCQQIETDAVNNIDEVKLKYDRLRTEFEAVVLCLNKNRLSQ